MNDRIHLLDALQPVKTVTDPDIGSAFQIAALRRRVSDPPIAFKYWQRSSTASRAQGESFVERREMTERSGK